MLRAAVTLGLLAAALSAPAAVAATGDVERASVATRGAEGDGDSTAPSISHDGSVVAFESAASTLVGGDTNGGLDVFTRRRAARNTQRISGGTGVSAGSTNPAVSADGGSVAFESFAPELGGGVFGDIFLRRGGGAIARLTAPTGNGDDVGGFAPSISADGTTVVFQSANQQLIAGDDNGVSDIFSWRGGSITRISEGFAGAEANGSSEEPALSSDGRFVAFRSGATNLAAGNHDVATWDIFVRALAGGTELVSGGFVRLRSGAIPAGSEIDTRRGVLRLTVGRATALVSQGRAIVDRTTLKLTGRKLLVRVTSGTFRTRAKRTTAIGRRAAWLTKVVRGKVTVRDLARRRTVRLRAGDRYRVRSSQARIAPQ